MADIFISYSSEDKTTVKNIASLLESKGWSVWWDRQIPIGQNYDNVIENELRQANCVIVIWTRRSIASEWVKNEALDAAQRHVLVPIVLEAVNIPLAFKRIESALLIGWNGMDHHPELELLFKAVGDIVVRKKDATVDEEKTAIKSQELQARDKGLFKRFIDKYPTGLYGITAIIGLVVSISLAYYYLQYIRGKENDAADQGSFYFILVLFGIAVSGLVFGVMNSYAFFKVAKQDARLKLAGPAVGVILILLGGFYLPSKMTEKNITIRVFDWKKHPLTQGDVKIYLKEYIRTQSIDKLGQALFTGIPAGMGQSKMKIEVSSPGYTTRSFDTLINSSKPLELVLPLTTVVFISGKVKTAAEMPIRDVEVNVEGTRYYALSITDGTYNLRLEEYTLGDEITITTSHKDYEDKTIALKINSPEIKGQDIFLNPVAH